MEKSGLARSITNLLKGDMDIYTIALEYFKLYDQKIYEELSLFDNNNYMINAHISNKGGFYIEYHYIDTPSNRYDNSEDNLKRKKELVKSRIKVLTKLKEDLSKIKIGKLSFNSDGISGKISYSENEIH